MVTKTGNSANNTLNGSSGADILKGLGGNDILNGLGGNDRLYGGTGDDSINGGTGNDYIDAGTGNDTIIGGDGIDTLSFSSVSSSISIYLTSTYAQYTAAGYKTISGIENLTGGSGSDYLYGDDYANRLDGGKGNDTLYGNGGTDVLNGSDGNDRLDGGYGNDTLSGGNGNDIIYGGYDNDRIYGDAGDDSIDGGDGNDTIFGGTGNDTIDGGYGGNDYVSGDAGDDTFRVNYNNATFVGGSGSDTVSFANVYVSVTLTIAPTTTWTYSSYSLTFSGVENLTGGYYGDSLTGDANSNILDGGSGNDTLSGGAGADTLIGGDGDDYLDGGSSGDFASYASASSGVTVDLAISGPQATGGAGSDTLVNIEHLIGTSYNDKLLGNSGGNYFIGGDGNDTIDGRAGVDTVSYTGAGAGVRVSLAITTAQNTLAAGTDRLFNIENLIGTSYDDILTGSNAANYLSGSAGDDVLTGLKGNDTLNGGSGVDIASYTEVTSNLNLSLAKTTAQSAGSAGYDTFISIEGLAGGSGNDKLYGNNGANLVIGNAGNDYLSGGNGNDTLRGGGGNDKLAGGAGFDTADYSGTKGGLIVDLKKGFQNTRSAGTDTLTGIENLQGGDGSDKLYGNDGANTISGGDGNDMLYGRGGRDVLIGGEGNDRLDAGSGTGERLIGGAGNDRYMLGTGKGSGRVEDAVGAHDVIDASLSSAAAKIDLATGKTSTAGGQSLTLASGGASTLPLDLVFLQDLSGSFGDDIASVRSLVPNIVSTVKKVNSNSAFGAVGFVDKPISPFGSSYGDYVYKLFTPVGTNGDAISTAYSDMVIQSGNDYPEAQLESLFQVAKRADGEVGFRSNSMRVVVLFTDAEYHVAGDGKDGGITKPNDGDAVIEGTGTSEDYPSVAQLKAALVASGILPIFAVTSSVKSTYADLVTKLGFGGVVQIDDASTNVVSAITSATKFATRSVIEDAVGSKYGDVIKGSYLANKIEGGAGNDKITGGLGADQLYGGSGKDTFIFTTKADSTVAKSGQDTIYDFSTKDDILDLHLMDANALASGNQAFKFIGTHAFTGHAGELRFVKAASDTYIYGDLNGDKKADFAIHLDDAVTLTKGDFML